MKQHKQTGFTLVELLVVIAIIAVIGTGISAYYGKEHAARAKRQMTLHEMNQIKQAFQQFHGDNETLLLQGLATPDGDTLPTAFFTSSFSVDAGAARDTRLFGSIEFFERFGLWPLMQPSIAGLSTNDFTAFPRPNLLTGEGWQGPYLDAPSRIACIPDAADGLVAAAAADFPVFPQMANRYNGIYRVIYYEHCEDDSDTAEPIYRRLLLVCSESVDFDTFSELLQFTGNRRSGVSAYPLDPASGTIAAYDESRGLYFAELLNMDAWYR